MSHSALCWWCLLRSVRATHRVAVHLTIRDVSVGLWCRRCSRVRRRCGRALCSPGGVAEKIL